MRRKVLIAVLAGAVFFCGGQDVILPDAWQPTKLSRKRRRKNDR